MWKSGVKTLGFNNVAIVIGIFYFLKMTTMLEMDANYVLESKLIIIIMVK
jgi:hypothetical protein